MTSRSGSASRTSPVGIEDRRRYLVRQAGLATLALVVLGGLLLVLVDRWRPTTTSGRVPAVAVLAAAAVVVVAALASRWRADLRTPAGRALWSGADRARVAAVKARLVQRLALPPEDRDLAAALVRAETSPAGRVATAVEALGVVAIPAVGFLVRFPATAGVLAVALVAVVALAPRWWLWRRLVAGARAEGLLP